MSNKRPYTMYEIVYRTMQIIRSLMDLTLNNTEKVFQFNLQLTQIYGSMFVAKRYVIREKTMIN
ncbi:MAG: hypothetical protein PHC69_09270 [Ruminiclostridium sp.]|nr:hypothetical protein [Ruminiclostridium sp.]